METLEKLSKFVGKYMAIIVLIIAATALFIPTSLNWIQTSWINYLLMIVMFGMGLTIKPNDFAIVFKRPKEVIIGSLAQFTIMPSLAFILGKGFGLEDALLVGLVLVGTCPGGTSSNVMSYLAKADVALSVALTTVSTLVAPILTPAITYLLLKTTVEIDAFGMFLSIIKVVIIPIGLGLIINKLFSETTEKISKILPLISVTAIVLIVASVVSANSQKILTTGAIVFVVVILHNCGGYALGYLIAKILKLPVIKRKTIAIEVGMQNSGLASGLATSAFPNLAMATVPGAIFSVWHNISGAILANIFANMSNKEEIEESNMKTPQH